MYMTGDRILTLHKIPGKTTKDSSGMDDPRLFTGENRLHIVKDDQTGLWSPRYDAGMPPISLRQMFTSYKAAFRCAEEYYLKRNITLQEVDE